jgi:hypothetical protein
MRDIDIKVIKFLVSGKAYSDTAIMKNLGIDYEELKKSYEILTEEGYLESYENYLARTQNSFKEKESGYSSSCGKNCCGGEEHSCSSCSNSIPEEDYKNIKVVTEKAVMEFE